MKPFLINSLKVFQKLYLKIFKSKELILLPCEQDPHKASQLIFDALTSDKPRMIGRFGAFELATLVNYLGVKKANKNPIKYIQGKELQWWWNSSLIKSMNTNAGFFPPSINKIEQFCELMLDDMLEIDILGSWLTNENYFIEELDRVKKIRFLLLDPFWATKPWTRALKNKKVLVIHPFSETIKSQYKKRKMLFDNEILPDFDLKIIKAVQSSAGETTNYSDWFEALAYMKAEIDKTDYDICLIGAGAYGFPLAAHVKRMGKKAFHVGGSLQLLFGIRGKRWEGNYNNDYNYASLINDYWVKPFQTETPSGATKVENACYW